MGRRIGAGLLFCLAIAPVAARAESSLAAAGAQPASAAAHLDFTIIIPGVLFLEVGGAARAGPALGAWQVALSPRPAAAASCGAALAEDAVTARVVSNAGAVAFASVTDAPAEGPAGQGRLARLSWPGPRPAGAGPMLYAVATP